MKNLNPVLLIISAVLLILNFYFISEAGRLESRVMRIVTSISFFIIYLFSSSPREKFFFMAFILLIVADLLRLGFELPVYKKFLFICMILVYVFLNIHISRYIKNVKANNLQKVILVVALTINIVMLFMVVEMAEYKLGDIVQSSLFFLYGVALISLMVFAFAFNHHYSNEVTFFFICAVLSFVFGDISGFIAYFVEVDEFYYPDRLFYLLALAGLVKFASLEKTELQRNQEEWL